MQEFQVDGNLMMANTLLQNVLLRCSKVSYCPVIVLTVKKHGCLTESLDYLRTRPALKVDCGIVEFCHIVDYFAKLLIRKHIAVHFHFV